MLPIRSPADSAPPMRVIAPSDRAVYALGHSARELERLIAQARLVDPITRRFFREAGIAPGMRVLDVGTGAGDVAFLAADLVGRTGEVIGVERAPAALKVARARAEAQARSNVSFREGDPTAMRFEQPFDAVVGRLVLMYYPDPAEALRRLASHLRPGGLLVFHETDWSEVRSYPPSPTYDRCCQWFLDTFKALGTETRMGIKLHSAFVAADLPAPATRLQAIIGGDTRCADWLHNPRRDRDGPSARHGAPRDRDRGGSRHRDPGRSPVRGGSGGRGRGGRPRRDRSLGGDLTALRPLLSW